MNYAAVSRSSFVAPLVPEYSGKHRRGENKFKLLMAFGNSSALDNSQHDDRDAPKGGGSLQLRHSPRAR
jgi:hypothetical protein